MSDKNQMISRLAAGFIDRERGVPGRNAPDLVLQEVQQFCNEKYKIPYDLVKRDRVSQNIWIEATSRPLFKGWVSYFLISKNGALNVEGDGEAVNDRVLSGVDNQPAHQLVYLKEYMADIEKAMEIGKACAHLFK